MTGISKRQIAAQLIIAVVIMLAGIFIGCAVRPSPDAPETTRWDVIRYLQDAMAAHQADIDAGYDAIFTTSFNKVCIERYNRVLRMLTGGY